MTLGSGSAQPAACLVVVLEVLGVEFIILGSG